MHLHFQHWRNGDGGPKFKVVLSYIQVGDQPGLMGPCLRHEESDQEGSSADFIVRDLGENPFP